MTKTWNRLFPKADSFVDIDKIWLWFMLFKTTFNSISVISWRSVILVKEIGVPGDNHWPVASHWQTLSHNVVSSTSHCTGSYKSKYHLIRPQQPPDKILSYSRTNLFIGSILCYNLFRLYFYFSCIFIFPGTICVICSFPFVFNKCIECENSPDWAQFIYYAPFVIIFQFGWASTQINHLSLIPDLTGDEGERVELNGMRFVCLL